MVSGKSYKRLTGFEKSVALALADTMAPPGCGFDLCAGDIDAVGWLDSYIQDSIPLLRVGALALFAFVEVCPVLLGYGLRRFRSLSLGARELCLERMGSSRFYPLRMAAMLTRLLVAFSIYQDDRVLMELGYDLPSMKMLAGSPPCMGDELIDGLYLDLDAGGRS